MQLTADSALHRDECEKLRVECEELRKSRASRRSNSSYLGKESFQEGDEKVKHYIGTSNFDTLMAIFSFVSSAVDNSRTLLWNIQHTGKPKLKPGLTTGITTQPSF